MRCGAWRVSRAPLALLLVTLLTQACTPQRIDLSINGGTTVFFVLGALSEYMGRNIIEGDDAVEGFYSTESEKAAVLVSAVRRLAAEQGWEDDVSVEVIVNSGHQFPRIRSPRVSAAIDSLYEVRFTSGIRATGRDGRYHRTARLFVKPEMIEPYGREAKLAFLAGAYFRFHRGEDLALHNAPHKVAVIVALLRELGAVDIGTTTKMGIPREDLIHFTPTPAVARWLHEFRPAG